MADNVTTQTATLATIPTSTVIATDEVNTGGGAAHVQLMKLLGGADGSTERIEGTAANGLEVDVTRVAGVVHVDDNSSTLSVDDGAGSLTVDGTVAASNLPSTVDTNSGNKSASTLRVVIATDQPALTNKLLVTPDANSAVNVAQMNGVATTMGNGVAGTGVQRVAVASDNTPFPVKTDQTTHGTTDLVAADITKVAGTALDVNSGNKSAGTLRVVLATDQPSNTNNLNVAVQGTPSVDTELPSAATLADAASNISTPTIGVDNSVYNGTTWDRAREVANNTDSAGTGIQAVGALAQFDDVSPSTVTENQFANLRMSSKRELYEVVRDAAGNNRGANVTAANELLVGGSGSAGSASAAVLTVQGVNSMTPIIVGGTPFNISNNFTRPADTTAYAAGDAVNNSTSAPTVLTLTSIARTSGGGGTISYVSLVDESNPGTPGQFELWIFDTTFTPSNDNAASSLSTTILRTTPIIIPLSLRYADSTTGLVYESGPLSQDFKCNGSANLFATLVVRNAYTPSSSGRFDLNVLGHQD